MVHFCGLVRAVPEHASQPFRRVSLPIPEPVTVGPFDPLAMFAESEERTLQELLETFADLRQQSIDRLRALQISETDLDKTGVQPEFGTVTLRQLLATWVAHDLNHLGQIAKVMARQCRAEVGPWQRYLGILD